MRVLRLGRRPGLPVAVVTIVFALAWIFQLWFVVLGSAAGTMAVFRLRRLYRRTVLPAVVAGTAAGLVAEEDDPPRGSYSATVPQAFSHVGLVNTAHSGADVES